MHRTIGVSNFVQLGAALSCVLGCATEGLDAPVENATLEQESNAAATNAAALACAVPRNFHNPAPLALRAVTFNAGLAPGFEPLAMERAPRVIDALKQVANDADLLCVQEFWQKTDFESLESSLTELPHVLRSKPRPGSGSCTDSELLPLVGCLGSSCSNASTEQLVGCAASACPAEVTTLSGGCLGCIMNHLDGLTGCLKGTVAPSDPAIFGGSYDIGLLSRWPIQRASHRELSSYFVRASVLHARVVIPQLGPIDAFCTHLGSSLGIVTYAGQFGSWDGEHARQVKELLDFVRRENDGKRPMLLMGDLNMGPQSGQNAAVLPKDYTLLLEAGFENAYASEEDPLCTYCTDSTFQDTDGNDELIDHILSARLSIHGATGQRLFVDPVDLGADLPLFNLSDHFGLKVSFARDH